MKVLRDRNCLNKKNGKLQYKTLSSDHTSIATGEKESLVSDDVLPSDFSAQLRDFRLVIKQ